MKLVICFLILVKASLSFALIPIEGLIYGDVKDIQQVDPLLGVLSYDYALQGSDISKETLKVKFAYYLYGQGVELKNFCDQDSVQTYENEWKKDNAIRSVTATLQYIGVDLALKSIAEYAKKLEYNKEDYIQLTENLVNTTCSKNLTIYSLKLLKDNFTKEWDTPSGFELPSVHNSPYYTDDLKQRHNTLEVTKRSLDYSIRNFRSLCSWNGDTEDFRLLASYLRNPFLMSIVFNNLRRKKMAITEKTKQMILIDARQGVQVACEDLICRRRSEVQFNRIFPLMTGSTKLKDDLYGLYCNEFSKLKFKKNIKQSQIRQWVKNQPEYVADLEALHLISLYTKIPEVSLVTENGEAIKNLFKAEIQERWNYWAERKLSQFDKDHLYEEPLEIRLIPGNDPKMISQGKLSLLFDIALSEIDRVLEDIDKIDSTFNLNFKQKYLAYIVERYRFYLKRGESKQADEILEGFVRNIKGQMQKKEKFFQVKIWNERIAELIANELMHQMNNEYSKDLDRMAEQNLVVPVKFRFGVFALRYIHQRFRFQENQKNARSFN